MNHRCQPYLISSRTFLVILTALIGVITVRYYVPVHVPGPMVHPWKYRIISGTFALIFELVSTQWERWSISTILLIIEESVDSIDYWYPLLCHSEQHSGFLWSHQDTSFRSWSSAGRQPTIAHLLWKILLCSDSSSTMINTSKVFLFASIRRRTSLRQRCCPWCSPFMAVDSFSAVFVSDAYRWTN